MAAPASLPPSDGANPSPMNSNNSSRTTEDNKNQIFDPESESDKNRVFDPSSAEPAAKRPRGRPPGSKNKPKSAAFVAVDPTDAVRFLEIAPGANVVAALASYASARGCRVDLSHAYGTVASVAFSDASPLKGRFNIVSLGGTVFPDNAGPSVLTISVADCRASGNVIGGNVGGPLIALSAVMVKATTSPMMGAIAIDRLPQEPEQAAIEERGGGSDNNSDPGPCSRVPGPGYGYNPNQNPNQNTNSGYTIVGMGNPGYAIMGMGNYGLQSWVPPQHQQFQHNGRRFNEE